jgi:uncharacterized protein
MAKARFEWDPKKDWENQEKHGVPFAIVQFAFADPRRVIAEGLSHSSSERPVLLFWLGRKRCHDGSFHVSK